MPSLGLKCSRRSKKLNAFWCEKGKKCGEGGREDKLEARCPARLDFLFAEDFSEWFVALWTVEESDF